jgi:hypothetical protein
MSSAINWQVSPGSPVLRHNLYLKYSGTAFGSITAGDVKADINAALASNDSAAIVSYLCGVLRVINLAGA